MPRAPNLLFAIIALSACGGDAVAPLPAPVPELDAAPAAVSAAPVTAALSKVAQSSPAAGLDDALARLIPALGSPGLILRQPLVLLRDDLSVANSIARVALIDAATGAVERFQTTASATQQPDLFAIRLTLDAIRVDSATGR